MTTPNPAPSASRRTRALRVVPLLGPALVAGVAYLDPGNVASNMTAGAQFGYLLVWVVVVGNLVAWLVQYLSAKLGLATGKSLTQILGERIKNKWLRRGFWVQAEIVAMATDLAEVVGGAIAFNLLFGFPLLAGGMVMGLLSLLLLSLRDRSGAKAFERVIIALLLIIAIGFGMGLVVAPPDPSSLLGGLMPRFDGAASVLLAASILGATIMPHAIYAHSALTRDRFGLVLAGVERGKILKATRVDVTVALVIAGGVNLAILLTAAVSLQGVPGTDTLEGVYAALNNNLGPVIAVLFAVGLLASGLASTSVGAYAGAEIMSGLTDIQIPLLWRRVITLIPAFIILSIGADPTWALIISQVVLSFGIPFALIPLVIFTRDKSILGVDINSGVTTTLAVLASVFVIGLNALLLWITFAG
ncbi:manganese transport protein [Aurantimicrobium minutum]|uniref:Nramp family divalent metal transporter n=1 Tax=Aurantimicrobium minutum TaxID=708131 RepID=UPI0024753400|nr:Nramp family divalent metal transporter [Aurantimicrobium minutum]MDH6207308.1 manganese transport protein [Aurantimicrobium minutum]MDH6409861.1 manganese transport protein [Aurantimicrobium minutum]MDH6424068.1 manganese transport protein [Aurantimicrobium minutum]